MSGQLVRRGDGPQHECTPPHEGVVGDVWQCDCGRRWTCTCGDAVLDLPDDQEGPGFEPFHDWASWKRRYWPWPRARREVDAYEPGTVDMVPPPRRPTATGGSRT